METERWGRIQKIFHEGLRRVGEDRRAFVSAECGNDTELRDEILKMLAAEAAPTHEVAERIAQAAAGATEARVPQSIGPYRVLREIGRGGMAVVYLAQREDLGKQVAIKVLPNAWVSPVRRERFFVEQQLLSGLEHERIARLYDAGVLEDGTPWFAMEWVDGEAVTAYCRRRESGPRQLLALMVQVCEAVLYAHQQAVLHRDLKPSNIFVKEDGAVKLLDFGIAKRLDAGDETERLTTEGAMPMTPAYTAPEVVRGQRPTVQADVYALGAVLYELLAGEPLVGRGTPTEILARIETAWSRRPSASQHRVSGVKRTEWVELDVLCLTALHPELERRYASVEALMRDLQRCLTGRPLEARRGERWYRAGKFVQRRRKALTATAAVGVLLASTAGYFTWRLKEARDEALAEAARARRIQQFLVHLFQGGDPQAGPAEDLKVQTLVDRGAQGVLSLAADVEVQGDLMHTLGEVYQNLGKLDEASRMLEGSLDRRRKAGVGAARRVESIQALGLLRVEQERYDEAEKLIDEAIALVKREAGGRPEFLAEVLAARGRLLIDRGKHEEAIGVLEEARRLQPPGEEFAQLRATILIRLANAQYYLARYDEAEALNRQILTMYERMYGQDHPQVADPVINLGAIAKQRGRDEDAFKQYSRAYEINRRHYGERHLETAASLRGMGQALIGLKRFDEAEPLMRRVVEIREQIYGRDHTNVATAMMGLAQVAQGREDLAEAERLYRRIAEIYRKTKGADHPFVAVAEGNLASVYLDREEFGRAERVLRGLVRKYEKTLPADHPDLYVMRIRLGRALLRQGKWAEAERESQAALGVLERIAPDSGWTAAARKDVAAARRQTR